MLIGKQYFCFGAIKKIKKIIVFGKNSKFEQRYISDRGMKLIIRHHLAVKNNYAFNKFREDGLLVPEMPQLFSKWNAYRKGKCQHHIMDP